jgi:hypothetical protein
MFFTHLISVKETNGLFGYLFPRNLKHTVNKVLAMQPDKNHRMCRKSLLPAI